MPDVSVILPVYNAEATIDRAVRSILDQTFRNLELIVVDDGSSDATRERLADIADERMTLITQPHAGVSAASNAALAIARSPLIARMDADDYAHPEKLARQLVLLESFQVDVVGCQVRIVDSLGAHVSSLERYETWINSETLTGEQILKLRFVEFPLVNPTILAKRSYFEIGFVDNDLPEDYELMLKAAARGMTFGKVDAILFDWTDHEGRATRTNPRYSTDAFEACRRRYLIQGPLSGKCSVDLWGVGKTGKPWLRWLQEQNVIVRAAYDLDQRKISQSIHGVSIQHPSELRQADGTPLVVAVGAAGARDVIRRQLDDKGYRPGIDTWFVA